MNSSWDNSYCVRLVIVLLAVNIGKLQPLVSEDNFFYWVYNDFCSDFLLCDVIDCLRMQKSVVESCLDKKVSDRLSSSETCWTYLLCLLMVLRRNLLQIDEASLFETASSFNIRKFRYTPSCLKLLRKSMSNFSLFFLFSSFSYFQNSLAVTFPCFRVFHVLYTLYHTFHFHLLVSLSLC